MTRPIRTLLFSTLYPSAARPIHGIFVETRLRELLAGGAVQTRVVAPVPWFPFENPRWGEYARMARTPLREQRHGIEVIHPRYVLIPKVSMTMAPLLLALACLRPVRRLVEEGFDFDLIDAHYFYPDGVAAALLARHFRKPLAITARGSDINLIADHALARRMMLWAARSADECIGVSQHLVDRMKALGIPVSRLRMMRNGVDLNLFRPLDRTAARAKIGIEGDPLLLSVGNLLPLKGHDVCIDALAHLLPDYPGAGLVIAGAGPEAENLTLHARRRGVDERVHLVGAISHADLAHWYNAADLLLLASSREGWPNVVLEAMACGTPVIGSAVGGIPEIMGRGQAGRLVTSRDGVAFAGAVREQLRAGIDRATVRRYAEAFGWDPTTQAQIELFTRLASRAESGVGA